MAARIAINRKEHFNAAHRLHNPNLTDEENKRIYGKCNNKNFHGHNYDLTVRVAGEVNEQTGYIMDTKQLSDIIAIHVLDVFDHKNMNLDIDILRDINPTTENVAIAIYNILRQKIDIRLDVKIILYETERNFVEYPA
jgi:6-pyruvoyltetrahydropterin/6-carboxytetrahydropterin synthase